MKHTLNRINGFLEKISGLLEVVLACFVLFAIVAAMVTDLPDFFGVIVSGSGVDGLQRILESVFTIVIAVEFLKMLLQPNSKTVIEVLIFLIARHMIVETTTSVQDLLSVISICLLFAAQFFLRKHRLDWNMEEGGEDADEKEKGKK